MVTPILFVVAGPMNVRILIPMGPKNADVRRSR
jgi:hypothetical protein